MTCIVGIRTANGLWMGADSGASNGGDTRVSLVPKLFWRGQFLIGYTTSFRMGQVLQHQLVVPKQAAAQAIEEFMVVTFIEAVRTCLKAAGFARVNENVEEGGTFLVGYRSHLFYVGDNFHINEWIDGLAACGCADHFALAAARVALRLGQDETASIGIALQTAAEFDPRIREPFRIERMRATEES